MVKAVDTLTQVQTEFSLYEFYASSCGISDHSLHCNGFDVSCD